jgi:hypothetical protein|tara:strand:- start:300 stop:578 length:279 start_codon:yes stop_codon:yes gene_type:complete
LPLGTPAATGTSTCFSYLANTRVAASPESLFRFPLSTTDCLILTPYDFSGTEKVAGFSPDRHPGQQPPIPAHFAMGQVMVLLAQEDQVGMAM